MSNILGPRTLTDAAYQASFPPPYQTIFKTPVTFVNGVSSGARYQACLNLFNMGYAICVPTMLNGWGAEATMEDCLINGISMMPAWSPSGVYDPSKQGIFKVSTDINQFPPYIPIPVPPPPPADYVGTLNHVDFYGDPTLTPPRLPNTAIYNAISGDTTTNGTMVPDPRGNFLCRDYADPFGQLRWYELQAS